MLLPSVYLHYTVRSSGVKTSHPITLGFTVAAAAIARHYTLKSTMYSWQKIDTITMLYAEVTIFIVMFLACKNDVSHYTK